MNKELMKVLRDIRDEVKAIRKDMEKIRRMIE